MNRMAPRAVAQKIFVARYAEADCLFLAGSVMRNEATKYSDLDLVVLYDNLENAYRESFLFCEWPVEAFIHDISTLTSFFESNRQRGRPSLASMVNEGEVIPRITALSNQARKMAKDILAKGPIALDMVAIDRCRYHITDLIDDIREPRSREEGVATGTQLYGAISDFYLRYKNHWSADGKTIPRKLNEVDSIFYRHFIQAFERLFSSGASEDVIALAEHILEPVGGFLFDGFQLDAPKDRN